MEENNEHKGGYAVLGYILIVVIALECICGALEVFGVSTGNFGGMVGVFIPITIIAAIILWAAGKLLNKDLFSKSWLLLFIIFWVGLSIIIKSL